MQWSQKYNMKLFLTMLRCMVDNAELLISIEPRNPEQCAVFNHLCRGSKWCHRSSTLVDRFTFQFIVVMFARDTPLHAAKQALDAAKHPLNAAKQAPDARKQALDAAKHPLLDAAKHVFIGCCKASIYWMLQSIHPSDAAKHSLDAAKHATCAKTWQHILP